MEDERREQTSGNKLTRTTVDVSIVALYCCLEFRVCCGITSVVACGVGVLGDE
jgi:hypothetical protein